MDKEIIIKPDEITALVQEGEKFLLKPEAEEKLIELLMFRDYIDSIIEDLKEKIGSAGKEINPNFKGVIGDKIRCIYRQYGKKYKFDWSKKSTAEPFLTKKEYWNVDTKKVDAYYDKVGELPDGIYEAEREDKLSILYKDE